MMSNLARSAIGVGGILAMTLVVAGDEVNLIRNPRFDEGVQASGIPVGWEVYGGLDAQRHITVVNLDGTPAAHIDDASPSAEVGLTQLVEAGPGLYVARVSVRAAADATACGAHLQMRFMPSGEFVQTSFSAEIAEEFTEVMAGGEAPEGTTHIRLYLYTHRDPTPRICVTDVNLAAAKDLPRELTLSSPVPLPITELKPLCIDTELVNAGQATALIIVSASGRYDVPAHALAGAIEAATGVRLPIVTDDAPEAAVPVAGNRIALGNRSTNAFISKLYDLYYTLLDLRYPGPNGHVVRTLHNPFGNGHNVVFLGGSDDAGVADAAAILADIARKEGRTGQLTVGRLMDIKLGDGIAVPTDLRGFETWEASKGYGSVGYFGWNSISKRMAMYYMTGDESQAREAIRLAFPDDQAKQEIADIDGERIENKDDPLGGPYHYNAHMMILFWDLIEESPVFSAGERLRVTQAFMHQLEHPGIRSAYGGPLMATPGSVSSRHGQWTAISLYCLGRYFEKDYPDPLWRVCRESGEKQFYSLHSHAWVSGENDNLFWYNTAIAPIFTYLVLTGDRVPVENGVMAELLRGQEILVSGKAPDWALNYASIGFLHKAAYVTGDGRWLTYRDRTGVDLSLFRLGQSFWPDESIQAVAPTDLVGKWSINPLPEPMWRARNSGLTLEESFLFMSCRTTTGADGDFILLDGFNGASRNPYHTFAILDLRLGGESILEGYLNQVRTRLDGMVEPQIAMNAALKHSDVLGETITATGEVPNAAYVCWRRTLAQRIGRYTLIVDELTPRADSEHLEIEFLWQTGDGVWRAHEACASGIEIERASDLGTAGEEGIRLVAPDQACVCDSTDPDAMTTLDGYDAVLRRSAAPGGWLEMPFDLEHETSDPVFVHMLNYVDRGVVRILLDGEEVVSRFNHYAAHALAVEVPLGVRQLAVGRHVLRVEAVDMASESPRCYVGLAGLSIRPESASLPARPVLYTSAAVTRDVGESAASLTCVGPAREGVTSRFFSLLAVQPRGAEGGCYALSHTAAAFALPEPGLAVCGEYEDICGEIMVCDGAHIYGHRATQIGHLVTADRPIDVDWDLATGRLWVAAAEATKLTLNDGAQAIDIEPGRHVLENIRPEPTLLSAYRQWLAEALDAARANAARAVAASGTTEAAPSFDAVTETPTGAAVVDLELMPTDDGVYLCAAGDKAIHVIGEDGGVARVLETDGAIRMIRWWPEYRLVLAGCADEQVIAFDETGARKWVFVSEMDPEVFRAAKTYWFKSAPGHEGIHGLHTGVFLDGASQAFVGSACTLEILDGDGHLVKRMPQFWGKVSVMEIIPGPGESLNLLAAREFNGTNNLAVINNRTLDPSPRGFDSVPAGHTHVPGWSAMNRHHIFFEEFDGDGVKEVMTEINGRWNRVTVWAADGTAKYDASFGPGPDITVKTMRDIDVADFDGDGAHEIVIATAGRMLVMLSGRCEKIWAERLDAPVAVLACGTSYGGERPVIALGCDDGAIELRDATGHVRRRGQLGARPERICVYRTSGGEPRVAYGLHDGRLVTAAVTD
ncbi:MAG TPA: VCBS repeat-containing protein [Candidatus Hydrogenedentes bacterium]|nr:VCBS repeat-containing protein [Candidatus Hydrogenedentota bacterium]